MGKKYTLAQKNATAKYVKSRKRIQVYLDEDTYRRLQAVLDRCGLVFREYLEMYIDYDYEMNDVPFPLRCG